jgi:hypothetical protein
LLPTLMCAFYGYFVLMYKKNLVWIHKWKRAFITITVLINYGFTSRLRIFLLYSDVQIASAPNLGLCSALRAFEQNGIFIVPHLLWHGTSVLPDRRLQSPLTTHKGMWRTYSNTDPHGSPISRLLRHSRGAEDLLYPHGVYGEISSSNLPVYLLYYLRHLWPHVYPAARVSWIQHVIWTSGNPDLTLWFTLYSGEKFVFSRTSNFSAIWRLSPLPATRPQKTYA